MAKQKGGMKNAVKGKSILPAKKKRVHKALSAGLKLKALELSQQGLSQREISRQ